MNRSFAVGLLATVLIISGCSGGNGGSGGTVDAAMLDTIKGYTQVIYQNDQENWPKYICAGDIDINKKQADQSGLKDKLNTSSTYDLSAVNFSIKQRNGAGDVLQLAIDSGSLKITSKSGTVMDNMPIPGSANGIRLKNENGWKVCYSANLQ